MSQSLIEHTIEYFKSILSADVFRRVKWNMKKRQFFRREFLQCLKLTNLFLGLATCRKLVIMPASGLGQMLVMQAFTYALDRMFMVT